MGKIYSIRLSIIYPYNHTARGANICNKEHKAKPTIDRAKASVTMINIGLDIS
jgi:hypothetical protein